MCPGARHLVVALPRLFPKRRAGAQPPTPPDPSAQGRAPSVSPGPTSARRLRLFVQPSTRHPAPPPPYDRVTRAPDGSERARGGPCPPAPSMAPSLSVRPGRTPRDSVLCAPPPSRLRASLLSWHVLGGPRSLRALSAGGPQLRGLLDPRPWSQSLPLTAVTFPPTPGSPEPPFVPLPGTERPWEQRALRPVHLRGPRTVVASTTNAGAGVMATGGTPRVASGSVGHGRRRLALVGAGVPRGRSQGTRVLLRASRSV